MAGSHAALKNAITLKCSAEIVSKFFLYGINSILYQCGIYLPETFTRMQKYGLTLLVSTDDLVKKYFNAVLKQIKEWLIAKMLRKLVMVVVSVDSQEVLEWWQFDIETDTSMTLDSKPSEKSENEIHKEIACIIRQITASITFLPMLENACSFDILIYTDKDLDLPNEWTESGPGFIANSQEIRLRCFTTTIHRVFFLNIFYSNLNKYTFNCTMADPKTYN